MWGTNVFRVLASYRASSDVLVSNVVAERKTNEMNATAEGKRMQDLPPKGGYGPIQTERIKLRTILGGKDSLYKDLISWLKRLRKHIAKVT